MKDDFLKLKQQLRWKVTNIFDSFQDFGTERLEKREESSISEPEADYKVPDIKPGAMTG